VRDSGKHGVIIGRDSYGQGSSREHAAICPMYLGIKVVAALAIERIHRANLVNFGIVPLLFADAADYDKIEEGDTLKINNAPAQLAVGAPVKGQLVKADGSSFDIEFKHQLSDEDIKIIKAGGRLNC
jgi:aconitate hydratase